MFGPMQYSQAGLVLDASDLADLTWHGRSPVLYAGRPRSAYSKLQPADLLGLKPAGLKAMAAEVQR